jgi:hypothetical protein
LLLLRLLSFTLCSFCSPRSTQRRRQHVLNVQGQPLLLRLHAGRQQLELF